MIVRGGKKLPAMIKRNLKQITQKEELPPFWTSHPKTWFFHACGVISDNEKIDNKEITAIEVQEFIVNPTKDSRKYDALKTALECKCRNESGHVRMVRVQTDQDDREI